MRRSSVGCAVRRASFALSLAALLLSALAAQASASTWNVTDLPNGSLRAALYGISCPSTSLCVAVGGNNTIASSADPTGGTGAWDVVRPGGSATVPTLPSAGASADEASAGEPTYGGAQIKGVSCPSTDLCVAVTLDGRILSAANPTGDASAWKIVPLTGEREPHHHMFGVSCPTASLCVAVAYAGKIITSTEPRGGAASWKITELPVPFDFRGVSCSSASSCVAVDNIGRIVASTNPTGGAAEWKSAGAPAGASSLNGISCASAALCVTANAGQFISSTDPTGGAPTWKVVNAGTGLPVEGVSCPSNGACAAVDNNSDVIVSTEPTGGQSDWWFKNVLPSQGTEGGNGMFAISCPTLSLCAAVGQDYKVITSADPFAPDPVKVPGHPRRPHVIITHHPAQRVPLHRGGVKVTFRFRAIGRAAGFRCRLGGRFRTCRSPARYRVGRGKHAFKVRAVAPGGARGPVATFHFRVGHLTERRPVGSCPKERLPTQPCIDGA